jgi:Na+/proline symporter
MLVGPVIWFIPPMVARIQHPDLAAMFPALKEPSEAAFVVMAMKTLPSGMIGLLIAGMFAATISSTDSGLNRNAGIFVRNFYRPILRPNASEGEQLIAGKLATLGFGCVIILSGLFLNDLKDLSLFDLMQQFSALVVVPVTIPLIMMVFVRRTPDWSAWSTVVLGLLISWLSRFVFPGAWWNATFELSLSAREVNDWDAVQGLLLGATILPLWFLFTRRFYREPTGQRKIDHDTYWQNLATPVLSGDETAKMDGRQGAVLGGLAGAYGLFVLLLALVPNPIAGRLAFVAFGCALIGLGALLYRAYNRDAAAKSRN